MIKKQTLIPWHPELGSGSCHCQGSSAMKCAALTLAEGGRRPLFNSGVRRAAFTLAEILITLAVIGVVAALTIPSIISNHKKQVVVTKIRKDYSMFQQAVKNAEAEFGLMETWNLESDYPNKIDRTEKFISTYLKPFLKIEKICAPSSDECWTEAQSLNGAKGYLSNTASDRSVSFVLADGQSVYIWYGGDYFGSGEHIQIRFDIDGKDKGDSMLGKDIFSMIILCKTGHVELSGEANPTDTNESLSCLKETSVPKHAGNNCAALIQKSGWKIPDDYPVKF